MSAKHETGKRKLDAKYLRGIKNPLLAIIVPIYNVEDYIAETLDSIVAQRDFVNYEVILVDDGSTDGSAKIAKSFAQKHPNVSFYQQENSGAGVARNFALTKVSAEYVTFVDSDDLIPENAYQWMLRQFNHPDVDISIGRMERFPTNQKFVWDEVFDSGTRIEPNIVSVPSLIHGAGPCNKMYRMSKIRQHDFRFGVGVHFEDAHFVVPYLLSCDGIGLQNSVSYLYRKRDNNTSVMDALFTRHQNYWDYLDLCDRLLTYYPEFDASKKSILDDFIIRGLQGFVYRAGDVLENDELFRYQLRIKRIFETVSSSSIKKSTSHPGIRMAYARILGRKSTVMHTAAINAEPLSIVGTKGFIGFSEENNRELRLLRQTGNIIIGAESLIRRNDKIIFEGRITAKHAKLNILPDARLQLRIAGKKYEGLWRKRPDRTQTAGTYSGFRFELPLEDLPLGEHLLHVFLLSDFGSFGTTTHKTVGLFRNSLPFNALTSNYSVFADARNRVSIRVTARKKKNVFAKLVDDYKNYKNNVPFAGSILLRDLTKPLFRKQILIIGERWGQRGDNGFAFFERLVESDKKLNVYYLSDAQKGSGSEGIRSSRSIRHSSWKHKLLMLHADIIANAYDVDTYTLPNQWDKMQYLEYLRPRTRTRRVFLQHGVIYRDTAAGLHRLVQGYDHFVTSTNDESKYVAKHLDYGTKRVIESGLPRFEKLKPLEASVPRRILFAPTWRSYLVSPSYKTQGEPIIGDSFKDSDYYKTINGFLCSAALNELLVKNDCILEFLPHPEIRSGFEKSAELSERIVFANAGDVDYSTSISNASVFITDYSSVLFDAAYMRKPSIYFTFDENEFSTLHSRKGYFDFERDGFGPVVRNIDDLISCIEQSILSGFVVSEPYRSRIENQFLDSDKSPSSIISKTIRK